MEHVTCICVSTKGSPNTHDTHIGNALAETVRKWQNENPQAKIVRVAQSQSESTQTDGYNRILVLLTVFFVIE
jgi:hypothetical protein